MSDSLAVRNQEKAKHITAWLAKLARLTRHSQTLTTDEKRMMLAEYCEMLLRRSIATETYNLNALSFVTDKTEWWPAVNVLAKMLEEFQDYHQTSSSDLTKHADELNQLVGRKLTLTEQSWIKGWIENEKNEWRKDGDKNLSLEKKNYRRRSYLSLTKQCDESSYEIIKKLAENQQKPVKKARTETPDMVE